jgi:tetratricopeptide (TPR) repeat protein
MITLSFKMGQLYFDQELYVIAEKYCERGLRIFQINDSVNTIDIALCMHKLGAIKESLLKDECALDFYLQSIHIFKTIGGLRKNVTMACSLHNAASIYLRQKNFTSALDLMLEAFHAAALGAHHFEMAASQHCLGVIYTELEDTETALFHLRGALKARIECVGTEHRDVAETMYAMGQAHYLKDDFENAIDCFVENLRVLQKLGCGDEELSRTQLFLGRSYQEVGDFDGAIGHLVEALRMMVSSHRENHNDFSQALFRLGICFCEKNQYIESLKNFKECLEIRTSFLGNLHIECANSYESIGIVQQKLECHEEAIQSFERALAIKRTSLDDDDEDICVLMHFIASSLFTLERFSEAAEYFFSAAELKKKNHGRTGEEYAMSVIDLAASYAKIGDERHAMEVRLLRMLSILQIRPCMLRYTVFFLFSLTGRLLSQEVFQAILGSSGSPTNIWPTTFSTKECMTFRSKDTKKLW